MTQRRQQILIVVGSIVFMLLVMVGAYVLTHRIEQRSPVSTAVESKPYIAESSRENARMITSSNRTVDRPVTATGATVPATTWSSNNTNTMDPDPPEPEPPTEAEMIIAQATAEVAPDQAIAIIEADLGTLVALGQAAEVYTVLGDLYLRSNPENIDVALQQYALAAESATDPVERHAAVLAEVEVRIAREDWEGALQRISEAIQPDDPPTPAALQLQLLKGGHAAAQGDTEQAEAVFGEVMRRSVEGGAVRPEASAVYRQAGARLIRLYRTSGRDRDAEAIEREMRRKESLATYFDEG